MTLLVCSFFCGLWWWDNCGVFPYNASMSDSLPEDVRRFLAGNIGSIWHLEVLLFLQGDPHKTWAAREAAGALYIDVNMTEVLLENLRNAGLLHFDSTAKGYQFQVGNDGVSATISEIATLYRQRRLSVISAIYSESKDEVRNFADAFHMRKKSDD
jgi:hypothetical protein